MPGAPPGESELVPELEDRLVILPEIKREGERFFLSSFKLPDKLTFAGQAIPLDNWQVRERIEYEFYQFLEDQGESIILAKRTGRCFAPAEKQLAEAGLPALPDALPGAAERAVLARPLRALQRGVV